MGSMGVMHEGYFVGRKELSEWIRSNFDPGFNKVEDLASGVVYCKIIDSIYPGTVPMSKVKKDAKIEVDFIHNFKILQTAFAKKKIDRSACTRPATASSGGSIHPASGSSACASSHPLMSPVPCSPETTTTTTKRKMKNQAE